MLLDAVKLLVRSVKKIPALLVFFGCLGAACSAQAGNSCTFGSKGLSMTFTLDPSSRINILQPVSGTSTAGDCAPGQGMTISGDNGLNFFNGSRNLKSPTGELIAYDLTNLPQSSRGPGNSNFALFTFSGAILWTAYANASANTYTDNVIISVSP